MFKGLELAICVTGIYVCFLTWGITQERVSTTPYDGQQKFRYFIFLNASQALIASLVSYLYLKFTGKQADGISRPMFFGYLRLAFFSCIASPFGYAALKHIDYPTLILGKSCKLIPVMLMNFLIYRRTYPLKKYLIVLLITAGVSSFMLWQPVKPGKKQSEFSWYGIGLLMTNLLIDGATNATQDQIFKKSKVTGSSMMMYMNAFSAIMMFVFLALNPYSTELSDAIKFCLDHPAVINDIVLFGICGAVGQCFIFYTLEHYGSIVLVTVTVTRKMFSILLSVFLFGHQLNLYQWLSVAVVFSGIILESSPKPSKKGEVAEEIKEEQAPLVQEPRTVIPEVVNPVTPRNTRTKRQTPTKTPRTPSRPTTGEELLTPRRSKRLATKLD